MSDYNSRVHGLVGRVFGRLTVIARSGKTEWKEATWLCDCSCGNSAIVRGKNLRKGMTTSCGCYNAEVLRACATKHGMKKSSEYSIWHGMLTRCHNKNSKDFPRYGGSGITVCKEWRESFMAFYNHIGPRPDGTTVDRIKGDLGYEPGNVRWATPQVQQRNKRNSIYITMPNGAKLHLNDVASILGITRGAAGMRLRRGRLDVNL